MGEPVIFNKQFFFILILNILKLYESGYNNNTLRACASVPDATPPLWRLEGSGSLPLSNFSKFLGKLVYTTYVKQIYNIISLYIEIVNPVLCLYISIIANCLLECVLWSRSHCTCDLTVISAVSSTAHKGRYACILYFVCIFI